MLTDEPARSQVEELLHHRPSSISAMNLAEVVDIVTRRQGHDAEVVRDKIDLLIAAGLEVEPVWLRVMWLATSLRTKHFHRTQSSVSLADCMCVATAISLETDLATTDPALANVARAAGVVVIALPDSNGREP
jgi:PIN domain nuclease of toxin-antitoxin system